MPQKDKVKAVAPIKKIEQLQSTIEQLSSGEKAECSMLP